MSSYTIDPLEVLKEDLKDENVEVQLEAIGALQTIATALGPERTAKELFVTLDRYCFSVDSQSSSSSSATTTTSPDVYFNIDALATKEEVLYAIAEELGRAEVIEYTGGSEATAKNVLPLLEKLAMAEETVIRQAAVASLNKTVVKLKVEHAKEYGRPILSRLTEADWFTSRCSASAFTPGLYKALPLEEDRNSLLECHKRLCTDDMPMVKNEAYRNLIPLIEEMKSIQSIISFVRPLVETLQNELMETLRQSIVDITKKVAEKLKEEKEEKSQDLISGFVKIAVEDDSWRVRKHTAENLSDICSHLKSQKVTEEIAPLYIQLLTDNEPQVRKAAVGVLGAIMKSSSDPVFAQKIVSGSLQGLVSDNVSEVREGLAEQIPCLGEYLGREGTKDKLLPFLKKLAADESPATRLNLCSKLANICKILGMDIFESDIIPLLKEVTVDQRWRVRNSVVVNIAEIGIQMGKDKFSKSRLKDILIQSLKDPAFTVRETAAKQLEILNQSFGFEWMAQNLFPSIKSLYKESGNYLHRMVPLKVVQLLSKDLTTSQMKLEFSELLRNALSDPISNVRFNACQALINAIPHLDSTSVAQFKTSLEKLTKQDDDPDVTFFALEALKLC